MDETPWPDVLDLLSYWKNHPPVHILVRGFFKIEDKAGAGTKLLTEEELRAAIQGL